MFIYGFPGDALKYIYSYWLDGRGLLPSVFPPQLFTFYFLRFNTKFFGLLEGYNVSVWLAFALAFLCAYALGRRYFERGPAVFFSLIYVSSNYFAWHGMQNVEIILAAAFLPIFLLALFGLEDRLDEGISSLSFIAFTSAAFSLVFLSSFYLGYFSLIYTIALFLIFRLVGRLFEGKPLLTKRIILTYFSFACLSVFLTLPATHQLGQYFLGGLGHQGVQEIEGGLWRNSLNDLLAYGARPWDYLMPSINHPIFGPQVQNFYQHLKDNYSYQYWSVFLPERVNYLTFAGMGLAFYAVWIGLRSWRQKQNLVPRDDLKNIFLLVLVTVFMFFLSLPAMVTFKGLSFPMPSYFLFQILPMFRVYARAGIFVLLGVSLLSAYGLKFLLAKIKNDVFFIRLRIISLPGRKSVVLTAVLCGLILFENLSFPPLPVTDVGRVPQIYAWLKNQSGDLVIVEYPKDNSVVDIGGGCPSWLDSKVVRDYNGAYESFYQIFHKKNVLLVSSLTVGERISVGDLSKKASYDELKKHRVDYLLIHTHDPMIGVHPWPYPQENPLDECWQRRIMKKPEKIYSGFKEVAEFDDGVIYKVE